MVKSIINVSVGRSSICWRGRRELITDVRKPEIMVMTSLQAESYLLITLTTSKLVTLNPKLKINRRRTLPASFPLVGCLPQAAWPERLPLRKVRTLWHCSRLTSVALYLWLIVVISVRQSTVAAISGLHCRALVMAAWSIHWQPDCKIQRSGRNGQRDWCMSRVTAIISALVICIIVCLSWAVNHYRDNRYYLQSPARQKCQNWSWRERGNYLRGCVTAVMLQHAKYTKELADVVPKMMLCVMMLPLVVVGCTSCQPVRPVREATTASGVDNAASPWLADTAERDYFTLRERLITMQKQLEGNPYINEQCRQSCPYRWAPCNYCESNRSNMLPAEYKCLKQ